MKKLLLTAVAATTMMTGAAQATDYDFWGYAQILEQAAGNIQKNQQQLTRIEMRRDYFNTVDAMLAKYTEVAAIAEENIEIIEDFRDNEAESKQDWKNLIHTMHNVKLNLDTVIGTMEQSKVCKSYNNFKEIYDDLRNLRGYVDSDNQALVSESSDPTAFWALVEYEFGNTGNLEIIDDVQLLKTSQIEAGNAVLAKSHYPTNGWGWGICEGKGALDWNRNNRNADIKKATDNATQISGWVYEYFTEILPNK